jgi:hypothetical protein
MSRSRDAYGPTLVAKNVTAWTSNKIPPAAQDKTPLNRAQRRGVAKLKRKAGDAKQ